MKYFVESLDGQKFDVAHWFDDMCKNKTFNSLTWCDRSPITQNAAGKWFWLEDYDKWIPLNVQSVKRLKKQVDGVKVM